jgi:hypothetical protein
MINGAHAIIYSRRPDADRVFLRDVLGLPNVDAGGGWLIFGLPPAEIAVHPSDENDVQELYLMCDDVETFIAGLKSQHIDCGPVQDLRWGRLTQVRLPGGGKLGVYQPLHARPKAMSVGTAPRKPARRATTRSRRSALARGRRRPPRAR